MSKNSSFALKALNERELCVFFMCFLTKKIDEIIPQNHFVTFLRSESFVSTNTCTFLHFFLHFPLFPLEKHTLSVNYQTTVPAENSNMFIDPKHPVFLVSVKLEGRRPFTIPSLNGSSSNPVPIC